MPSENQFHFDDEKVSSTALNLYKAYEPTLQTFSHDNMFYRSSEACIEQNSPS